MGLLYRYLSASRLVTIAQIEGRVRGVGSEFVLACDMRFAARESAIFGQFEPAFGTIPGGGAVQHIVRLMGRGRALVGDIMQEPPMVSAVKQGGVPLYKLARKGIEVERKARLIHVYTFRFTRYEEPIGWFKVACTKGTYVRSLAHELGQKLGCGAHLETLRLTTSGRFDVTDAIPFEDALRMTESQLEKRVIPMLKVAASE